MVSTRVPGNGAIVQGYLVVRRAGLMMAELVLTMVVNLRVAGVGAG